MPRQGIRILVTTRVIVVAVLALSVAWLVNLSIPMHLPLEVHAAHGTSSMPYPASPIMLVGGWVPPNPHAIDFHQLPRVASEHAVVSDVRDAGGSRVNQHNYLIHYKGRFWAMWSDGPGVPRADPGAHRDVVPGHDRAGQHVSYATSADGITWSETKDVAGPPDDGFGWIARGFWNRDGELLALASRFRAPGYPGDGLQLHAFRHSGKLDDGWTHHGLVCDDTLNNFAPKKLPTGEWMMSRRTGERGVYMIVGGVNAFDEWESFPVVGYGGDLLAEEPYWWVLPDGNLVALFRDNGKSGYLYRAFSTDNGRSWTQPVRTDFPDARSKFSGLQLKDGRYVLVSNPNPEARDPLALSISEDGIVFTKMGYLVGGRHVDYPHVIEHDGYLYVAFASAKQTVEVLKIAVAEVDRLEMPTAPLLRQGAAAN